MVEGHNNISLRLMNVCVDSPPTEATPLTSAHSRTAYYRSLVSCQAAGIPASFAASARKIRHFKQQLFNMPDLRSSTSTSNLTDAMELPGGSEMGPPLPPPIHATPNSSASEQERSNNTDD